MAKAFYQGLRALSISRTGEKFHAKAAAVAKNRQKFQKIIRSSSMKGAEPFFIDKKAKIGILLIHGFTSTPYQFKDFGKFLTDKGFTVYAPLVAGHGTSPEDLMNTTMEDWKASVREAYATLKKRVHRVVIVGNSFGGNLAFYLARTLKDPPAGIISLGTPITLRSQWLIRVRLSVYGWTKTYYYKDRRIYRIDYTDMVDEITYPVIPIKSLREFFKFIKTETIPNLENVHVPTLITHAEIDPVVHPKSALYIHQHISSPYKMIYWFQSYHHGVTNDKHQELFMKAYEFIQKVR